jgi:hypothetical protein
MADEQRIGLSELLRKAQLEGEPNFSRRACGLEVHGHLLFENLLENGLDTLADPGLHIPLYGLLDLFLGPVSLLPHSTHKLPDVIGPGPSTEGPGPASRLPSL